LKLYCFLFLSLVFRSVVQRSRFNQRWRSPPPQGSPASITVPAGTKIELVVTRPERAQSAKDGDTVYAQTSFPTVAGGGMAIPAGTYVEGTIESVTRPTRKFDRAEIQVLFTKIIFASGYTVELPGPTSATQAAANPAPGETPPGQGETLIAITIQVTPANDLLLDNGAEVEMTLGAPLQLDAKQVAGVDSAFALAAARTAPIGHSLP
jgi:hypothetical protein